jgi:2-methylcitrate dehydratase PrpD
MLRDGRHLELERRDYPGFNTNPMSWNDAHAKFLKLASAHASPADLAELAAAVEGLEDIRARDLTRLLARVHGPAQPSTIAA